MPAYEPIGRTDDVCPSCLAALPQRPELRTMCPAFGEAIFVCTRPDDGGVVLVNDSGRRGIKAAKWAKAWIAKPFSAVEAAAQLTRLTERGRRKVLTPPLLHFGGIVRAIGRPDRWGDRRSRIACGADQVNWV